MTGLCVKWFTDNRKVTRFIDLGSPKLLLQEEARRNFDIFVFHGISIESEWGPRASNEQADYLSRIVDSDDWSVSFPFPSSLILDGDRTLLIALPTNLAIYCLDLIPGFVISPGAYVLPWANREESKQLD